MVVQKNDIIYVPEAHLGEKTQVVKWSQSLMNKEATYVICKYTNITQENQPEHEGVIYVQQSKLDEFKSKAKDGDKFTIQVSDQFQYGQEKGEKNRWLVYHDKGNKPYQHRFIESTIVKYGNMANAFALGAGYKFDAVGDVAKRFVGDYLHDF